jgi:hypothetical protein
MENRSEKKTNARSTMQTKTRLPIIDCHAKWGKEINQHQAQGAQSTRRN